MAASARSVFEALFELCWQVLRLVLEARGVFEALFELCWQLGELLVQGVWCVALWQHHMSLLSLLRQWCSAVCSALAAVLADVAPVLADVAWATALCALLYQACATPCVADGLRWCGRRLFSELLAGARVSDD
ncbi:MAG: hypothetical protein CMI16_07175 [Opitutaceae bacterium]|nr:hypothetical protein [Opitutaceae bacterium]|tara:strand:+ start:215 stop:613 length:399 start_codon:yes stop_codon:yes gene_type:complete